MSDTDARDLAVRVAKWIVKFFEVRWTRELSTPARTVVQFDSRDGSATVRLTVTSQRWFRVEANGGFSEASGGYNTTDEFTEAARRLIFDIGYGGLVVVRVPAVGSGNGAFVVGPPESGPAERALDVESGEIVEQWWGWPRR